MQINTDSISKENLEKEKVFLEMQMNELNNKLRETENRISFINGMLYAVDLLEKRDADK